MAFAPWGFLFEDVAMMNEDNILSELLNELTTLLKEFPEALERRAAVIQAGGKDPELAGKLVSGADAMRDSGNIYLSWARHYAALSKGTSDAADEEDEADFGT
ncbi:MAG: hypothetical protein AB1411_02885 [Nitrospirota bacterium]